MFEPKKKKKKKNLKAPFSFTKVEKDINQQNELIPVGKENQFEVLETWTRWINQMVYMSKPLNLMW